MYMLADVGRRMKGPQKEEISTVVVERIRRRLRQNGFRCHITLQASRLTAAHSALPFTLRTPVGHFPVCALDGKAFPDLLVEIKLSVQMVPSEGELHSHMHVTPLRSSRALALRFLANKFGLDMSKFTVSHKGLLIKDKHTPRNQIVVLVWSKKGLLLYNECTP